MNKLLLIILPACLLCGCRQQTEAVAEYRIVSERMEQLDEMFNFYGYVFLDEADSCILKAEGKGELVFKKIDYRTGTLKNRIRKGRGPNEYPDLRVYGIDSSGCFYASTPAKVCNLIRFSPEGVPLETTQIDANSFFTIPLCGRFVSYGDYFADDGRMFLLSDSTGRKITRFGEFPDDGISCQHRYKTMAYQGKLIANERLSRFAYLLDVGDVFDIYEIGKDAVPRLIFSIREKLPHYVPNQYVTGVAFKDSAVYYGDAYSSDKYIYALYSGEKVGEMSDVTLRKARETNLIRVFDWDGRRVCDLIADIPVLSLCVSSDDTFILALYSDEGEIKCCRFSLPAMLSA